MGMVEQVLHTSVLGDQFHGRLFADARHAWNVVGGIAPQANDVDDLLWPLDSPPAPDFGQAKDFHGISKTGWLIKESILRNELGEILVRRHHIGLKALLLGPPNERADEVIR